LAIRLGKGLLGMVCGAVLGVLVSGIVWAIVISVLTKLHLSGVIHFRRPTREAIRLGTDVFFDPRWWALAGALLLGLVFCKSGHRQVRGRALCIVTGLLAGVPAGAVVAGLATGYHDWSWWVLIPTLHSDLDVIGDGDYINAAVFFVGIPVGGLLGVLAGMRYHAWRQRSETPAGI
jgi:hypothetical protein